MMKSSSLNPNAGIIQALLSALIIFSCNCQDKDGDGFSISQGDCADNNRAVNPATIEIYDGVDNNCNGQIDENAQEGYDLGHWIPAFIDPFDASTKSFWSTNTKKGVKFSNGVMDTELSNSAVLVLDDSKSCSWWGTSAPIGHEIAVYTKIRLNKNGSKSGTFGYVHLKLLSNKYVECRLRKDGIWLLSPTDPQGGFYNARIATDVWHALFIAMRKGALDIYFDGKLIFRRKLLECYQYVESIGLGNWQYPTSFSDFQIFQTAKTIKKSALPPIVNLVRNASFEEHYEDIPSFWYTLENVPANKCDMKIYRRRLHVDGTTAFHGNFSMMLEKTATNAPDLNQRLYLEKGKNYKVSMYLKTESPNMTAKVHMSGAPTTHFQKIDQEWGRRYEVDHISQNYSGLFILSITPESSGKLWIDAIQLEEGKLSTPFVQHPEDEPISPTLRSPAPVFAEIEISKLAKAPVIDGKIVTKEWAGATPLFQNDKKTKGWLGLHNGTLFGRFELKGSDPNLMDNLQVVLSPYFHFGDFFIFKINKDGQKQSQKNFDFDWNHEWKTAIQSNSNIWTIELQIPLDFVKVNLTSPAWGINVLRTNHAEKQINSLSSSRLPYPSSPFYFVGLNFKKQLKLTPRTPAPALTLPEAPTLTLNGKATIPFSVSCMIMDVQPQLFEYFSNSGFQTIFISLFQSAQAKPCWCSLKGVSNKTCVVQNILDFADKNSLKVILAVNLSWKDVEIAGDCTKKLRVESFYEPFINTYKNHNALLAWWIIDEPAGQIYQTCKADPVCRAYAEKRIHEISNYVKSLDSTHPRLINFHVSEIPTQYYENYWDCADIFSFDKNAIGIGYTAFDDIKAVVEMMRLDSKKLTSAIPIMTWMQHSGPDFDHARQPTSRELSAMTYLALTGGSRGFYYISGIPVGEKHWQRFVELKNEIQTLSPILQAKPLKHNISFSPSSLCTYTKLAQTAMGNELYIICVNPNPYTIFAKFDLSSVSLKKAGQVQVKFENRIIKISKEKTLTDVFTAFERHVYHLISP
ncbi:hypothetical protein JXA70_03620 [candidate division KSB1 bacterium]|nr:hypothetical protein [candidate division KSB1 bacterium]